MSDYMEYYEFYKKSWERSLSEKTSDMQKEIETLRAENARYREALQIVAEGEAHPLRYYQLRDLAREALKGGE